ncbi:diol dehydratase small subunit [Vibrio sp. HN007]|uniref:diol dehydratase small subunit n=1 Tax=Vibrio iocasae TaxID=3098914 RepID=UPI0035D40B13
MNSDAIESMVRDVLAKMNSPEAASPAPAASSPAGSVSVSDYPLAEKRPDLVKTSTGKTADQITLEGVMNGQVDSNDVRITPEVLRIQADIARCAGRERLAVNFERAAELAVVEDERVLEIYNALRPYRSSKQELLDIARELEIKYQATICAGYVREAAERYEERKKLKGDD